MDTAYQSDWVKLRTQQLYEKSQDDLYRNADQLFKMLMFLQLGLLICVAFLITPTTWIGENPGWQFHVVGAVLLGSMITAIPFFLTRLLPAAPLTRHTIAICQIVWSILFIHMAGGRVETHFHIFASLALLTFYRDSKILVTASIVVVLDQLVRGHGWPMSVFGEPVVSSFRWLEYVGWILLSDLILLSACFQGNHLSSQLCHRQAQLEQANRDVEEIVWSRTKDLKSANRNLKMARKMPAVTEFESSGLAGRQSHFEDAT